MIRRWDFTEFNKRYEFVTALLFLGGAGTSSVAFAAMLVAEAYGVITRVDVSRFLGIDAGVCLVAIVVGVIGLIGLLVTE